MKTNPMRIKPIKAVRLNASVSRGFTLIELMVSIGIIALLIGILLPTLGGARDSSRAIKALANGRSVGQTFALYANRHETNPYLGMSEEMGMFGMSDGIQFTWWPGTIRVALTDPFATEWAWPAAIADVAPWEEHYETWVSPGLPTTLEDPKSDDLAEFEDGEMQAMVSWRYSNSFIAAPGLWDPDATSPVSMNMVRPTRPSDVVHPSSKVMLWDTHLGWKQNDPPEIREGHWDYATPMVFADGHAEAKNPLEATEGTPNFLRQENDIRLNNTPYGVRGVDY